MSVLVDSEDVDSAGGQGLLSAIGDAVRLWDDTSLTRRNDVLPIGIDAHAEYTRIVMPVKEEQECQKHVYDRKDERKWMTPSQSKVGKEEEKTGV